MHSLSLGTVTLLLTLALAPQASAVPHPSAKTLCKEIRKAVSSGRTLEQITAEFNTDARHVMKCMESRGKSHKTPKKGKSSGGQPAKPHKQAPAANRPATHPVAGRLVLDKAAVTRSAAPRAALRVRS
jgi:hypothetical protein